MRPDPCHRHKGRCDDVPRSDPGAWRSTVGRGAGLDTSRVRGLHMNAATISTTGNEGTTWHALAADDVVRRLNTNVETGLDAAEVPRRLAKYGPNRLPEAARRGPFKRFLLQFNNVLINILLVAAFVKLMMHQWVDAAIILGV